jgi:hypothetical protein
MRLILDFCERVRIMELGLACTPNIQEFPRSRVMRYVPNFSQRPIQNVLPEAHAATGQQLIISSLDVPQMKSAIVIEHWMR